MSEFTNSVTKQRLLSSYNKGKLKKTNNVAQKTGNIINFLSKGKTVEEAKRWALKNKKVGSKDYNDTIQALKEVGAKPKTENERLLDKYGKNDNRDVQGKYGRWTKIKATSEDLYKHPLDPIKGFKSDIEGSAYGVGKWLDVPGNYLEKGVSKLTGAKFSNKTRQNIDAIHKEVQRENKPEGFGGAHYIGRLAADTVGGAEIKAAKRSYAFAKTVGRYALANGADTAVRAGARASSDGTGLEDYAIEVGAGALFGGVLGGLGHSASKLGKATIKKIGDKLNKGDKRAVKRIINNAKNIGSGDKIKLIAKLDKPLPKTNKVGVKANNVSIKSDVAGAPKSDVAGAPKSDVAGTKTLQPYKDRLESKYSNATSEINKVKADKEKYVNDQLLLKKQSLKDSKNLSKNFSKTLKETSKSIDKMGNTDSFRSNVKNQMFHKYKDEIAVKRNYANSGISTKKFDDKISQLNKKYKNVFNKYASHQRNSKNTKLDVSPVKQPVGQPIKQPVKQPVGQPIKNADKSKEFPGIKKYLTEGYSHINDYLRGFGGGGDYISFIPKIHDELDKLPNFSGTTYRFIKPYEGFDISKLKPGSTYSDPGFLSSGKHVSKLGKYKGNDNIKFIIKSNKGKDVSGIDKMVDESEVLFKPGTKFHIDKVDGNTVTLSDIKPNQSKLVKLDNPAKTNNTLSQPVDNTLSKSNNLFNKNNGVSEGPKGLGLHTNVLTKTLGKGSYQLSKNPKTKTLAGQLLKGEVDHEHFLKDVHEIATKTNKLLGDRGDKLSGKVLSDIGPSLSKISEGYNHSGNIIKLLKSGLNKSEADATLKVMDDISEIVNSSLEGTDPKLFKAEYDKIFNNLLKSGSLSDIISKSGNTLGKSIFFKEAESTIKSLIPHATNSEMSLLKTFLNDAKGHDDKFDHFVRSASGNKLIGVSNVLSGVMSASLLGGQVVKQLLMSIPDVFRSVGEVGSATTLKILTGLRSPHSKKVMSAMGLDTEGHYLDVNNSQNMLGTFVRKANNALLYGTYATDQHIVKPLLALGFHDTYSKYFRMKFPNKSDSEIFDMATNAALVNYSNRGIVSRKIGSSAIHNNKTLKVLTNLTRYVHQMGEMIYTHPIDSVAGSTVKEQTKLLINSIKNVEVRNSFLNLADVIKSPIGMYTLGLYATTELVSNIGLGDFTYYGLSESDPILPFKITKVADGSGNFNDNYEIQPLTANQLTEKLSSSIVASGPKGLGVLAETAGDAAKYGLGKVGDLTGSDTLQRVGGTADASTITKDNVDLSKYDLGSYPQFSQMAQSDLNKFWNPLAGKQISNWFQGNDYKEIGDNQYIVPSSMGSTQTTDLEGKLSKQYFGINPDNTSYENTHAIDTLDYGKEQDDIHQMDLNTGLDILKQTSVKGADKAQLKAMFIALPQNIQDESFVLFDQYNKEASLTTSQNAMKSLSPEDQAKIIDYERNTLNKGGIDRFNAEMKDLAAKGGISPKVSGYLKIIDDLKKVGKYNIY